MQFSYRLQTFMGHKEKEAMINSFVHSKRSSDKYFFVHSNFSYGPKSPKLQNKVEKNHERSLKLLTSLDNNSTVRNSREKTSFTPAGNFAKLFDTPTLGNSKVKNQDPWKLHMGFS